MPTNEIDHLPTHPSGCPCGVGAALSNSSDDLHAAGTSLTVQYSSDSSGLHTDRISDSDIDAILFARSQVSGGVFDYGLARWNIDLAVGKGLTLNQMRNSDIGMGTGVELKYLFPTSNPLTSDHPVTGPASSFRAVNSSERSIILDELAKFSSVANIKFTEGTENTGKTLSIVTTRFVTDSGFGNAPGGVSLAVDGAGAVNSLTFGAADGDVFLDSKLLDSLHQDGLTSSDRATIATIVRHEVGHALGLSHPFGHTTNLDLAKQVQIVTVMSYNDAANNTYGIDGTGKGLNVEFASLGLLDILAMQKLYGANPNTAADDDTYSWNQASGFKEVIYDAGGKDTIDLSASTMQSHIDLTPNSFSSINLRVSAAEIATNVDPRFNFPLWTNLINYRGEDNLGIVGVIENVKGGSGADRINGNSVNNEISGGAGADSVWGGAGDDRLILGSGNDHVVAGTGNDFVDGGAGVDVAGMFGPRSSYTVTRQADGSLKVSGSDGANDAYQGVEFLAFNDGGKVGLWMTTDVKLGGFDEGFYLAANPDVAAAVEAGALRSGWEHYNAFGKAEGRMATFLFDKDYYLSHNSDVKAAGMDAWAHFMNYGWREGRDPSAYLDISAYLEANQDLKAASVNPLTHYLQYGQAEGRLLVATGDLGFDWTYMG